MERFWKFYMISNYFIKFLIWQKRGRHGGKLTDKWMTDWQAVLPDNTIVDSLTHLWCGVASKCWATTYNKKSLQYTACLLEPENRKQYFKVFLNFCLQAMGGVGDDNIAMNK